LKISGEGTVEFTLSGDDICRLSAEVQGKGWEVKLFNELAAPADGKKVTLPVYLKASPGCSKKATVTLTAVSEISRAVAMVRL
jgi:hypothetical protein